MGHDSVVRQSYGSDYFAVQKSIKSTTIHHQLTQYCISIIIKQKEKSLNPCSLSLPCMVFLGSSGWKKKVLNCSKWNRERHSCGFKFISGKTTEQP